MIGGFMTVKTIQQADQKNHLFHFFILSFGISWICWIPSSLASYGWNTRILPDSISGLLGAFGPSLAAVFISYFSIGNQSLNRLIKRFTIWRIPVKWVVFVFFWPAFLSFFATWLYHLIGGRLPDFSHPPVMNLYPIPTEIKEIGPWPLLPVIFFQNLFLGSAMGEEMGWRGFALPRLQQKLNPLFASLVLGIIWAIWHVPLYFNANHPLYETFWGWTFLGTIADAIIFTWVFNKTRGSLIPVLLLHASIATTGLFISTTGPHNLISLLCKGMVVLGIIIGTESFTPGYPAIGKN